MRKAGKGLIWQVVIVSTAMLSLLLAAPVQAERIKDLASLQGVRNNQLIGYGIIVGLDNSGDQTTQTPFTTQAIINMLSQLGVNLPTDQASKLQLKNVAAVMVTANLPPFSRVGQNIDVTVSSMGNAKSLRGGTLLMTPLKGADGQVYAMAQGGVAVGGAGASAGGGASVQVNHLSAGRIPAGATVERVVSTPVGQGAYVHYELSTTDFGTVQRVVEAINREMGAGLAQAVDGRQVRVRAPDDMNARVAFLGRIENLDVKVMPAMAKVIVNPRTGSVVMNQTVTLESCAVAHGNLSVVVGGATDVQDAGVEMKQESSKILSVKAGASLADVVKALNALGANPMDLLAILQAMKAAGALRADLEII
ncbi:MAG: flagellar basal body P-ring protein FlgI [Proteobacteria bacterium]|nr:flagellar basal body P-ring protein FlgI [Pseudomonadota bacterium]